MNICINGVTYGEEGSGLGRLADASMTCACLLSLATGTPLLHYEYRTLQSLRSSFDLLSHPYLQASRVALNFLRTSFHCGDLSAPTDTVRPFAYLLLTQGKGVNTSYSYIYRHCSTSTLYLQQDQRPVRVLLPGKCRRSSKPSPKEQSPCA